MEDVDGGHRERRVAVLCSGGRTDQQGVDIHNRKVVQFPKRVFTRLFDHR